MNKDKLLLALSVLSGRVRANDLSEPDWYELDFDPSNFFSFHGHPDGHPDDDEVKRQAEAIIADAIVFRWYLWKSLKI